ncbi:MAG: TetR/AcrR family transcriptional regulator [Spirochaetales bacterium]|nr:TetR/AcrR family transcriptional regulator [Spirochaetales bacterium]
MNAVSKHGPSVRERLVQTAMDLFYRQGYAESGLKQILKESAVARASFYDHFASKEELALYYLQSQSDLYRERTRRLMEHHPHPLDYVEVQVRLLRKAIKSPVFFGCALANFAALPQEDRLKEKAEQITREWCSLYAQYFDAARKARILLPTCDVWELAIQFKTIYEGSLILWRMSGQPDPIVHSRELYRILLKANLVDGHLSGSTF